MGRIDLPNPPMSAEGFEKDEVQGLDDGVVTARSGGSDSAGLEPLDQFSRVATKEDHAINRQQVRSKTLDYQWAEVLWLVPAPPRASKSKLLREFAIAPRESCRTVERAHGRDRELSRQKCRDRTFARSWGSGQGDAPGPGRCRPTTRSQGLSHPASSPAPIPLGAGPACSIYGEAKSLLGIECRPTVARPPRSASLRSSNARSGRFSAGLRTPHGSLVFRQ